MNTVNPNINRIKLYWIAVLLFVILFAFQLFRFDQNNFDTYYVWSSAYFLGTLIMLTLLFILYGIVTKILMKTNLNISNRLFYSNYYGTILFTFAITILVNYITYLADNYLDLGPLNQKDLINEIEIIPHQINSIINYSCLFVLSYQIIMIGSLTLKVKKSRRGL